MERPREVSNSFCGFSQVQIEQLASAQVKLLRKREALGVPVDLRSVQNLGRLHLVLAGS